MITSFKISISTRNAVLLILGVGVLFNIISFFHFRFSTVRRVNDSVKAIEVSSLRLYDDVLKRVDDYMHTVSTNFNFSSSSAVIASEQISANKDDTPLLPLVDSIDYDYFVHNGRHIARIGRQDFSDGSPYPRGGVISRVYDDCLILDGKYRVARSSRSSGSFSANSRVSSSPPSIPSNFDDLSSLSKRISTPKGS